VLDNATKVIAPTPAQWQMLKELGMVEPGHGALVILHPVITAELARDLGQPEDVIRALGFIDYDFSGSEIEVAMDVILSHERWGMASIREALGLPEPEDEDDDDE